jgi:hypothetical protein
MIAFMPLASELSRKPQAALSSMRPPTSASTVLYACEMVNPAAPISFIFRRR